MKTILICLVKNLRIVSLAERTGNAGLPAGVPFKIRRLLTVLSSSFASLAAVTKCLTARAAFPAGSFY